MKLCPPSTIEIYTTFQDLYVAVNIHILKKGYVLLQNVLKKIKKENYKKYRYNIIRRMYLKPKNLEKEKRQLKKINVFLW